jgi:hypothetical protein
MSDSVPVYVFRIADESLHQEEMQEFTDVIGEAKERAGLDAEFVLLNADVTPLAKDELREWLDNG